MKVVAHPGIAEFWQAAGELFTADPVRNTVAITVLSRLLRGGRFSDQPPILLTVHDTDETGELAGAALCTPPFPITVTALPPNAAAAVAVYLAEQGVHLSAVSGTRTESAAFAEAWRRRTGVGEAHRMNQRLYRLDTLVPPADVPGQPAVGGVADIELLTDWRIAFIADADVPGGRWAREAVVTQVEDSLAAGNGQLLWRVDGRPVSHAAVGVPRSGVSRIGPVYTPPEHRGHGYGSAVTAAAARWAMEQGAEHVVLFTDLANPTSNSIYQRIGFVPVADALDITFAAP
ncbi:MAG TPA: GNAT family N-acetyltransferase [Pseudonocardiaceae bacterium]|nr:GNAT family N-acetyltransferase [Pseudonocardiaceae bacterium]